MYRAAWCVVVVAVLSFAAPLSATVVIPAEFREIVADAALIVRGHVTDVRAEVVPNQGVETVATIAVDATLKGTPDGFVTIRIPGGVVGRYRWVMVGAPSVTRGEQGVFFLKRDAANAWRPVGLAMGIYAIRAAPLTRVPVVEPPLVAGRTAAVGTVVRGASQRRRMAVSEFESLVSAVTTSQAPAPATRSRR
jgi:hypothetical protein